MGSVLAASSPTQPPPAAGGAAPGLTVPPGFGMPPVSTVLPSSTASEEAENRLPNPGGFEECHRKCKGKLDSFKAVGSCTMDI